MSAASFAARVNGRDLIPKFFRKCHVCLASSCWFGNGLLEELGNVFRQMKMLFTVAGSRRNDGADSARPSMNLLLNNPTS